MKNVIVMHEGVEIEFEDFTEMEKVSIHDSEGYLIGYDVDGNEYTMDAIKSCDEIVEWTKSSIEKI